MPPQQAAKGIAGIQADQRPARQRLQPDWRVQLLLRPAPGRRNHPHASFGEHAAAQAGVFHCLQRQAEVRLA